jgi:putative selenium metabolism protein SsnA
MQKSAILLVGNGWLVTRNKEQPLVECGCVAIQDGLIAGVGTTAALRQTFPTAQFVDARGGLILPGLINAHMHLYSTFARGMALKDAAPSNFVEILKRLWWRLDKVLSLEDVYLSALVAMIDCIRNGVTTIFDHHSSPGAISGSLFRIADAANLTGLRSCLCYEVTDREGEEVARQSIEENRVFLTSCHDSCRQSSSSLLRGLFGLHASFTLTDHTLAQCTRVASELEAGFHVHVAEAVADVNQCQHEHGKRVVERFHDWGILGNKTIAAHCVHVDDREIGLLQSSKTNVIHNPESNMGNAVGCAPVLKMVERGVRVGMGSDGYTCDMFESLKVANLLHKHQTGQPAAGWVEPQAMLFDCNADLASACFGHPIGRLIPGACADVIVVDYYPPTPLTVSNINSHLLFGVSGRAVRTTIIGGHIAMLDRELPGIDEVQIIAKANESAARLWCRF